jgi:hypothetical protein
MTRIDINWSKEELNNYLKKNYGYEYWNFANSVFWIDHMFESKKNDLLISYYKKRISLLEITGKKVMQIFDDLLTKINFYKTDMLFENKKDMDNSESRWSTKKRQEFIIKCFNLEKTMSVIKRITKQYQRQYFVDREQRKFKARIKPLNFLILVWSHALTKNNRIEWSNLESLLKWFRRDLYNVEILGENEMENSEIPSEERMRYIHNRYKGTMLEKVAKSIFDLSFVIHEKSVVMKTMGSFFCEGDKRINYSDPIRYLKEALWLRRSPEGFLLLADFRVGFKLKRE